ncbi:MAG TPA: hypothetical protein VIV60_24765 [Polyangiaceae bacterium]
MPHPYLFPTSPSIRQNGLLGVWLRFWRNQRGASYIEYLVVLGVIALGLIGAWRGFDNSVHHTSEAEARAIVSMSWDGKNIPVYSASGPLAKDPGAVDQPKSEQSKHTCSGFWSCAWEKTKAVAHAVVDVKHWPGWVKTTVTIVVAVAVGIAVGALVVATAPAWLTGLALAAVAIVAGGIVAGVVGGGLNAFMTEGASVLDGMFKGGVLGLIGSVVFVAALPLELGVLGTMAVGAVAGGLTYVADWALFGTPWSTRDFFISVAAGATLAGLGRWVVGKFGGKGSAADEPKPNEPNGGTGKAPTAAEVQSIVDGAKGRIAQQGTKFELTYSDKDLGAIIAKGKQLGLDDKTIEDLIFTGSRKQKPITADELMQQMENWTEVSKRGYPYKFESAEQFKAFSNDLVGKLDAAGIPTDDVRIQGSSLRNPNAGDVDIAVFVDDSTLDNMLVQRYDGRAALANEANPSKAGTPLQLAGKSHEELMQLAEDISKHPEAYNGQASTFANAMRNRIISSKSDISKPLKTAAHDTRNQYPSLNVEGISIEVKGGAFDMSPSLPVSAN